MFALGLEQLLHRVVLTNFPTLQSNIWLYATYGGLAAGAFEEVGRYVAMKLLMKKRLDKQNALMYGAGHGGIEAIIIAGLTAISNLVAVIAINSGNAASMGMTDDIVSQLCIYPSALFLMSGVERIFAMTLHICLSYIVYRSIKDKKPAYFFLAIAIHFAIDAEAIIVSNYLNVYLMEALLLVEVFAMGYFVLKVYKNEKTEVTASVAPEIAAPETEVQ